MVFASLPYSVSVYRSTWSMASAACGLRATAHVVVLGYRDASLPDQALPTDAEDRVCDVDLSSRSRTACVEPLPVRAGRSGPIPPHAAIVRGLL